MLLGPVQSLTYALNYGWPSAALGSSWARRMPWQFALSFGVLARVAGVSGYVALTSWTLGAFFIRVFFNSQCGFGPFSPFLRRFALRKLHRWTSLVFLRRMTPSKEESRLKKEPRSD